MASDLKMEIFAYKQFYALSMNSGTVDPMKNILQVYGDECMRVNDYSECCDDVFRKAIQCRNALFADIFANSFDHDEVLRFESLSEFYNFVNRLCDNVDLFGHLTIFEKIFSTISFVMHLCLMVFEKSLVDVVNYSHIIWAMYFDKFIDEFYRKGGWNELKRVAETYIDVYNLFFLFDNLATQQGLKILKEAAINYCQLKNAFNYYYNSNKHKDKIHISTMWVKLRSYFSEEYISVPSGIGYLDGCFEIEILLQHLKHLCNSSQNDYCRVKILQDKYKESTWPTRILYSKTYNTKEEIKKNNNLRIQNLATSDNICDEFLGDCSKSSENIINNGIIDKNEHSEINKECSFETTNPENKNNANLDGYSQDYCHNIQDASLNLQLELTTKMSTEIADLGLNPKFSSVGSKNEMYLHGCCDTNGIFQFEAINASKSIPVNLDNDFECRRKTFSKNLNPVDLCSGNQTEKKDLCSGSHIEQQNLCSENQVDELDLCFGNLDEKNPDASKISERLLESSFWKKSEGVCNENAQKTNVLSSLQTSTNCCNKNGILNNTCTPNDSLTGIEVTNNSDGKTNNRKDLEQFKEQNDPEIREFLRMILILGDN